MEYKFALRLTIVSAVLVLSSSFVVAGTLTPKERLGEKLYFDKSLSEPDGQSCASCHIPSAGFADPDRKLPVSEGVIGGLFGERNSPTASYAMYVPKFGFDSNKFIDSWSSLDSN